jgi:hypothetical protein
MLNKLLRPPSLGSKPFSARTQQRIPYLTPRSFVFGFTGKCRNPRTYCCLAHRIEPRHYTAILALAKVGGFYHDHSKGSKMSEISSNRLKSP